MTLISASSLTPPKEILTYFLLRAFAIEWAIDVLPTPGGPTKQIIGLSTLGESSLWIKIPIFFP